MNKFSDPSLYDKPVCYYYSMNDFISIDFETAMYAPNSAISIGLVKYHNYQPVDFYYSLIRPPKLYIRPNFTDIHGLTVDDVKDAPDFGYIWKNAISEFLGKMPLAAHNASFDIKVLKATLVYYNIPMPENNYFCSLALSRQVWPAMRSHGLTALAKEFNIVYKAHNALADAETCGKIIGLCAWDVSSGTGMEKRLALSKILQMAGIRMGKIE